MVLRKRNSVVAVLRDPEGKVLIGFSERINSGDSKNVDTKSWKFPQGGIDEGETPSEALVRELKEELGFDLDSSSKLFALKEVAPYYFKDENDVPEFEVRLHPFLIDYSGDGDFDFDRGEFSEMRWLSPDEVPSLNLGIRRDAYLAVLKKFDLL